MLAAHRDQENLVHAHQQVQSKQHPKTPGARFPKTPHKFPGNDENAPTIFAGKSGIKNVIKPSENDILMTKGKGARQALITPSDNRMRAPLGNKTTNAKAKTGPSNGVKDIVKELEKAQKPTTIQKPKQKPVELAPVAFSVKADSSDGGDEEEEPEYAPANPEPLPYQSDVLPPGGLTTKGLRRENMFKGYYEHFYNPIDDNGVSRKDKEFRKEMDLVMKMAEERNAKEMDALDWNVEDATETAQPRQKKQVAAQSSELAVKKTRQKYPATITSRRAASALSVTSDTDRSTKPRPASAATTTRKPPSTALRTNVKSRAPLANAGPSNSTAETASRTTLGYNKGRSASSLVHGRPQPKQAVPSRTTKPAITPDKMSELTITPARVRQAALSQQESKPAPAFTSIFDLDGDDEDLPPMRKPAFLMDDDDEEEFELKLEF
ncbi:hypothetical protein B0I35DRAFT_409596 [Stachybotrys elegans]|uniref:Uncharacterized protein n=1 Tax=Stachybotrys elegans TaxID=80388 RepID=A0A8K0WR28_9HYPO|nr:hypothetical protein B0I35DRAFT_409596 [Stachybotrys elegans]